MPTIQGWESSQTGCYSHSPALTLSGKSQPILAGLDSALSPLKVSPRTVEQPGSWHYNTPSADPGAGGTAAAQCRMTSRQVSHRLPLLVLLLLLIKARLVGRSWPLCRVASLCSLASGWVEGFRCNLWIGDSLPLVMDPQPFPEPIRCSLIHGQSQKPAISFS